MISIASLIFSTSSLFAQIEPVPEPQPEPQAADQPELQNQAQPEPEPEPEVQPEPEPEPEPQVEPEPEPEPKHLKSSDISVTLKVRDLIKVRSNHQKAVSVKAFVGVDSSKLNDDIVCGTVFISKNGVEVNSREVCYKRKPTPEPAPDDAEVDPEDDDHGEDIQHRVRFRVPISDTEAPTIDWSARFEIDEATASASTNCQIIVVKGR